MLKFPKKQLLICAVTSAVPVFAGSPAIGIAVSQGNFAVDNIKTPGNATIFDGNVLQTSAAPSQVRLKDGAQIRFAEDSRGKLYLDHVDLEKGSANISGYSANALGLRVRADANGSATVTMKGNAIEVAALTGKVHVFNAKGLNVANVAAGSALSLRPQDAGASAPSALVGCAVKQGNDLVLTDETSNVTVRLSGAALHTGKRVQLTGAIVPGTAKNESEEASDVMMVSGVQEVGGACKPAQSASGSVQIAKAAGVNGTTATVAAAAGAATATTAAATVATAGAAAGVGFGTTTAVVAGVAAAAAVGTATTVNANGVGTGGNPAASPAPICLSPCGY